LPPRFPRLNEPDVPIGLLARLAVPARALPRRTLFRPLVPAGRFPFRRFMWRPLTLAPLTLRLLTLPRLSFLPLTFLRVTFRRLKLFLPVVPTTPARRPRLGAKPTRDGLWRHLLTFRPR